MSEAVYVQTLMMVLGTIGFLASLKFIRRLLELKHERRIPVAVDGIQERLERIESAVEATALEVERISEATRFMTKLLADRGGPPAILASPPERVITPH
jgi:hypothetical protein